LPSANSLAYFATALMMNNKVSKDWHFQTIPKNLNKTFQNQFKWAAVRGTLNMSNLPAAKAQWWNNQLIILSPGVRIQPSHALGTKKYKI
jgi:hypothetical protein